LIFYYYYYFILFYFKEEEFRNNETCSRSNRHEAELCVRLCRYLIQQGYSSDSITILTAYSGQVFALTNVIKQEKEQVQGMSPGQ
jgi:superfamily I DNA and/or RNA helicase